MNNVSEAKLAMNKKDPGRALCVAFGAIVVLSCLAGLFVAYRFFRGTGAAAAIFVLAMLVLFVGAEFAERDRVLRKAGRDVRFVVRLLCKDLAVLLALAFVLEFLTLVGSPASSALSPHAWKLKRVVIFWGISFIAFGGISYFFGDDRKRWGRRLSLFVWQLRALALPALVALAFAVVFGLAAAAFARISLPVAFLFFFALAFSVGAIVAYVRGSELSLEAAFLAVLLSSGLFMAAAIPGFHAGLDEQIHYRHSVELSYIVDSEHTLADRVYEMSSKGEGRIINLAPNGSMQWSADDIATYSGGLDANDSFDTVTVEPGYGPELLVINAFGYVPSACGLWLGRLLHLPFSAVIVLGRFFNLLFYGIVCAIAIWVTPIKKRTLALVSLLPLSIFTASFYSYDPWLTSLMFLATAMVLRARSERAVLSTRFKVALLLVFFLGLAPKAVYFPLMGLVFLIPRECFRSTRDRARFILCASAVVAFMAASFALPMLVTNGGSVTDTRGGSDVNASGQVAFILQDVPRYLGIFGNYVVTDYVEPVSLGSGLLWYGYYQGMSRLSIGLFAACAILVSMLFVVLTDFAGEEDRGVSIGARLWTLFCVVITVFLIVTALYVSFNPVGATGRIEGVQRRYLLPVMGCLLALVLSTRIRLPFSQRGMDAFALSVCTAFAFLCSWLLIAVNVLA